MNISDELIELFENDDERLFDPPQKTSRPTPDDILAKSFKEIIEFVEEHDRMPDIESPDISEATIAKRLESIKHNTEKVETLKPLDSLGLLDLPEPPSTIDELFNKDDYGLFSGVGDDILNIKNVPAKRQVNKADEIAERKPAEDFDKFKPLFEEQQSLLENGDRKLTHFITVDQLKKGSFYVQDGMMVYVAEMGEIEHKGKYSQQRMRVIYENGVESNMYRRSLAQRLYEGGFVVVDKDYVGEYKTFEEGDSVCGYIYVLKSKSQDTSIATIKDLYKIGFSTVPVTERIKDAENNPTYLMAPVEIVDSYILTGDYNPQKIEHFLHRIFADAALELKIFDKGGKKHTPKEWYSVPLPVVEQAINLLQNGEITGYVYDNESQSMKAVKNDQG